MITRLLEFRETMIVFYKRYENYCQPLIKFLVVWLILAQLNKTLGYAAVLNRGIVNVAFAVVFSFVPGSWLLTFLGVIIVTHLAFVSIEAALIVGILLLILYLMYIHLASELSYLLIAVPLLFSLNIPYVVPIFAGLFLGPTSLIAIIFGTVIYYFSNIIPSLTGLTSENISDMPTVIIEMYKMIVSSVFSNKELLFTIIAFCIIFAIAYWMKRLSMDHIWYITIGSVSVATIFIFLIGNLLLDLSLSVGGILFFTLVSAIILGIIQFFKCVVDYSRVERVEYEDDDYYYYVKAVPKIHISSPQKSIKRIK